MTIAYTFAFQPIVCSITNIVFSYEALIRGKNQEPAGVILSKVSPEKQAEFDFEAAKLAIVKAIELGLACNLNVNFLPNSLLNTDLILNFIHFVQSKDLNTNQIIIELTEVEVIKSTQELLSAIKLLRSAGMQIAIDDFGAGYSGLNLLVNYQPQIIKLDMHLVRNVHNLGPRQAVIKAILNLCVSLGIDVIAEGVETVEEFEWLKKHNVELFQGYLLAKPGFENLPLKNISFN